MSRIEVPAPPELKALGPLVQDAFECLQVLAHGRSRPKTEVSSASAGGHRQAREIEGYIRISLTDIDDARDDFDHWAASFGLVMRDLQSIHAILDVRRDVSILYWNCLLSDTHWSEVLTEVAKQGASASALEAPIAKCRRAFIGAQGVITELLEFLGDKATQAIVVVADD